MAKMILKYVANSLVVLFGVSMVVFVMARPDQSGPVGSLAQDYLGWWAGLLNGDFGTTLTSGAPVAELLMAPVGNSLALLTLAGLIAIPAGVVLGIYAGLHRDTKRATGLTWGSRLLSVLPAFVVGIALIGLIAVAVGQVPPAMTATPGTTGWEAPGQLLLPALTLALIGAPAIGRVTRASIIEALDSRFVEMARLKGVPDHQLVFRHALPHAIGPVARVLALQLTWLLGAIVVVEYLFNYHGVGQTLIYAIQNRDMHVVQTIALLMVVACVIIQLLARMVGLLANPQLRSTHD